MHNEKGEILLTLANGDVARRYYKGIIIDFAGKRKVVSTSALNGGSRDDLTAVFNYNCLAEEMSCQLYEDTYEKELAANARTLKLEPQKATGLSTAAWMEMASVVTKEFDGVCVTAIVTGGIDTNATRVGEGASYYEKAGEYHRLEPGTINILLHFNCNMPFGTLTRALMTCAQAKAVACEELFIGSLYSTGLATGSGTDGIIAICDDTSENMLTDAGEHSKLGELIGKAVIQAVKESLYKQTGAGPARQHKLLVRVKRYGITMGTLWEFYEKNKSLFDKYQDDSKEMNLRRFEEILENYNGSSTVVVWSSLYVHILDQMQTKMLEWAEGIRETKNLSHYFLKAMGIENATIDYKIDNEKPILAELIEQMKYIIIIMVFNLKFYD